MCEDGAGESVTKELRKLVTARSQYLAQNGLYGRVEFLLAARFEVKSCGDVVRRSRSGEVQSLIWVWWKKGETR